MSMGKHLLVCYILLVLVTSPAAAGAQTLPQVKPGQPGRSALLSMPRPQLAMARRPLRNEAQNERQVSQADSMNCSFYYLKGLGNKVSGNFEAAQDNFRESLRFNPANDAAWYELALQKLDLREYAAAIENVQKALTLNQRQIWYLNLLATIYDQTGEHRLLAGVYQRMEHVDPHNFNYFLGEAAALTAAGQDKDAIAVYERVEKIIGKTEEIEFQKQKIYVHLGRFDKAVESMHTLIRSDPKEPRYRLLLADIYRSAGQPAQVLSSLKAAVAIDSVNGYAQLALVDFYREQGDHPSSFAALRRAFASNDLDPEQKKKLLEDNYVNIQAGDAAEGKELARILLRSYPNDTQIQAMYAGLLSRLPESTPDGRDAVVQLLETNRENYSLWVNLVISDFNLADYRLAAKHSSEALGYFPDQINLYWYSGIALNQSGHYKDALGMLKKGLGLAEGQPVMEAQILQVMGDAYHSAGESRMSNEAYRGSLKRRPDDANTLNNYGYFLCLRKKDLPLAASMVEKANRLEPGNANFEDTFAWILFMQKKYTAAKDWILRAIAHDNSHNPTFFDHYGDILFKLGEARPALENWNKARAYGSKNLNLDKKIANLRLYE